MKFATPLIILLVFGWTWSEIRNASKDAYIQEVLQERDAIQVKYDDEHWKAVAQDSAMAKDERMQAHTKLIIDQATKRHAK